MRATHELPPEELVMTFEAGFAAMWRRAGRTLGEVTLSAILERVLYNAGERFPALSVLGVDRTGLSVRKLSEDAARLERDQLSEGLRFVLVEFLTVLGNLTDEILTPALHEELSNVTAAPEDDAGAKS